MTHRGWQEACGAANLTLYLREVSSSSPSPCLTSPQRQQLGPGSFKVRQRCSHAPSLKLMDAGIRSGGRRWRRGPVWATIVLVLMVLTSFCLAILSLWHALALKHEVAELRSQAAGKRGQQQAGEPWDSQAVRGDASESVNQPLSTPTVANPGAHGEVQSSTRITAERTGKLLQPCLQMMPDRGSSAIQQDHTRTTISWHVGLRRGSALVKNENTILVREEGFYFVYSQVYYMDKTFVMGHVINRIKHNIVGSELQKVTLFRCIRAMSSDSPFNTCYTAGTVKLEVGDSVELLIPRQSANISLDGDTTFFGAIRLL
ncbi:tumor necrosis factor ligand superfamily member 13B isoform X1 [Arapaima gigas]